MPIFPACSSSATHARPTASTIVRMIQTWSTWMVTSATAASPTRPHTATISISSLILCYAKKYHYKSQIVVTPFSAEKPCNSTHIYKRRSPFLLVVPADSFCTSIRRTLTFTINIPSRSITGITKPWSTPTPITLSRPQTTPEPFQATTALTNNVITTFM